MNENNLHFDSQIKCISTGTIRGLETGKREKLTFKAHVADDGLHPRRVLHERKALPGGHALVPKH
jgi:hypothetical protein